jgi:hypothetical protein
MNCQRLQKAPRVSGGKRLIERRRFVRVEMVQHDPHPVRLWVPLLHQPLHVVGAVRHSPVRGHGNLPPPGVRCTAHQPIAGAMALVFLVIERGLARVGGSGTRVAASSCWRVSAQVTWGRVGSDGAS